MKRRDLLRRLGFGAAGAMLGAKVTKAQELPTEHSDYASSHWFASVQVRQPSMVMYWGASNIQNTAVPIGIPISQGLLGDAVFTTTKLTQPPISRIGQRLCRECDEWTPEAAYCIECGAPLCE